MRYVIWNDADFREEKIKSTADKILANEALIHLLEPSEEFRLHQAIERMAKLDDVDSMMLTRLRFAYNLHFDLSVELRKCTDAGTGVPVGEAKSFAELVEMLPEDEAGATMDDYRIVIDDLKWDEQSGEEKKEDKKDTVKRMIAEIFQQFVFLNLNMDIMSKSEIQKTIVKERFRKDYPQLRKNLALALAAMDGVLDGAMLSQEGQATAEGMRATLQEIEEEMAKARKRPIRIAAMGTKKAGKSVIINTLLGQEYAPTSSELPTPNIIQYVPEAPDSRLWMRYKDEDVSFDSADELRTYIQKEFEEAQQHTGEGAGLKDMVIHYPTKELTGFEIYDTPGPNFAGAGTEHETIAANCIERADVCIFVMNYSTHLTTDEVKFLEKIHGFFKEKGKFYSLLIAVNRVDERYSAEVEKSVTRVVDYIRKRMEGLEYPNIVTFGTSALQSFYLGKIRQLCGQGDVGIDRDTIEEMAASKENRKWMTQLDFIETSLRQLKRFHGYKNPTDCDLERMSGVPQLGRYVRYIGEQKADLEIVDYVIGTCEMKAKRVKNALGVTQFKELAANDRKKIYKLRDAIRNLEKGIKKILKYGLEYALAESTEAAAKVWLHDIQKANGEEACKKISNIITARVVRMDFSKVTMDAIYGGKGSLEIEKLQKSTQESMEAITQETGEQIQHGMEAYCEDLAVVFRKKIEEVQADIKDEVKKIDQELEGDKDVQAMFRTFELPQFPMGVDSPMVQLEGINAAFDPRQLRGYAQAVRKDYKVPRSAEGILESIFAFFGKTYEADEHKYDVEDFRKRLKASAIEAAEQAMKDVLKKAEADQEKMMSEYIGELHEQRVAYEDNYNNIFEEYMKMVRLLLDDTVAHKEAVQRDIAAFTEMNQETQPFFDLFDDIIEPMQEV